MKTISKYFFVLLACKTFIMQCAQDKEKREPLDKETYFQKKGKYTIRDVESSIEKSKLDGCTDSLKECLDDGFSPDVCLNDYVNHGKHEFAPILCITTKESFTATEFLLERGALANAADYNGDTPLHHALNLGDLGTAYLLMQFGGNPQARNNAGKSALEMGFTHCNSTTLYSKLHEYGHNFYVCLLKQKQKHDQTYTTLEESCLSNSIIALIAYLAFGRCANTNDLNFLHTLYVDTYPFPTTSVYSFDECIEDLHGAADQKTKLRCKIPQYVYHEKSFT